MSNFVIEKLKQQQQLLETLNKTIKEKQEEIRNLANDLRSPIAKDIAQYQIKKNKNRPVMRTFQDLYFSVVARKLHEARQKSDFLEGKDAALRKVVDMFNEMKKTEAGRTGLLSIQESAMRTMEGRELMTAIWEVEQKMEAETRDDFFWPEELDWDQ